MFEIKQNAFAIRIGRFIESKLNKYESILFLFLIISLALKILTDFPAKIFINLILVTLAILYFFCAFADHQDEIIGGFDILIYKLISWGCSIGIIGILFGIENWPGYNVTTTLGCITLIISLIIILISKYKKLNLKSYTWHWILRIVVIIVIGLLLRFISTDYLRLE